MKVCSELVIEAHGGSPKYEHADVLLWVLDYQPTQRWSALKLIMDRLEHQHDTSSRASKNSGSSPGMSCTADI